ncbi:MAG: sigma-70 family RNA polymerase sigma factor [Streptosporangiaceae bacterium]
MTADLISRARAGDGDAFRQVTEPHRRELQVHCYRMLGSFQDAEDAVQDTLLAAWQGLGGFEGRASLRTWLYRIATNRCLNARRSASRRPREWNIPAGEPPEPDPARRGRMARAVSRRSPGGCDRPGGPL